MTHHDKEYEHRKHERLADEGLEEHEDIDYHEEKPIISGPIKAIIGVFMLLIIVLMVVPFYGVRLNPEPKDIPSLDEIQAVYALNGQNYTYFTNIGEAINGIDMRDQVMRQISAQIASESCPESKVCHAKAMYYFVRDNIDYVSDPSGKEYIAMPKETLLVGGGDCDDGTLLLSSMLEAVGVDTEVVLIPGHAFLKARLPDAPRSARAGDWVYMDWTCKNCDFGTVPPADAIGIES